MAATVVLWPIAGLTRLYYRRPLFSSGSGMWLFVLVRAVCVIDLAVAAGLFAIFGTVPDDVPLIASRLDSWLTALRLIGWLGAAGTFAVLYTAAVFWLVRAGGLWLRIHHTLVLLACSGWLWSAWNWHLLDLSSRF